MAITIKNGAKVTIAGEYEGNETKTEKVTLSNKTQLVGDDITFAFTYIDSVTGSKFNDSVNLLTAPPKKGTIDLGKGDDTLQINAGDYLLTVKNTETVLGNEDEAEELQLSGVATFNTDGTIDTLLGDKSAQTITYTSIIGDSTIDLNKGKDFIILEDSIGDYTVTTEDDALIITADDGALTIINETLNKTLKIVMNGVTYTWEQALAYAADDTADVGEDFLVTVAESDEVTNNTEKTSVQLTISGVDSDAASVVVWLAQSVDAYVEVNATKQSNGTWTLAPQDISDLADGGVAIYAKVTDAKGNESWVGDAVILEDEPAVTLTLDTTADLDDDLEIYLTESDSISQTAKDNSNVTPIQFTVDGLDDDLATTTVTISDGTTTVEATLVDTLWEADLSGLGEGPYTATVSVMDEAGNSAIVDSSEISVISDSFTGTVTEFQSHDEGYFDDYVSVIVEDTANAFNGSDLSGGNWANVTIINVTDANPVTFNAAELAGVSLTLGEGNFTVTGSGEEVADLPETILASMGAGDSIVVTDALSVAELETLVESGVFETDAVVEYALSDTALALLELTETSYLTDATTVTVEGDARTQQITDLTLENIETHYSSLQDTADNLSAFAELIVGNIDITVIVDVEDESIGDLTLSVFNDLNNANGSGTITFKLSDDLAGLFDADVLKTGAAAAIAAAEDVTVTEAVNLAQANAMKAANTNVFTDIAFSLNDTVENLFSGQIAFAAGASDAITAAEAVTIVGGLTFSRALLVNGANANSYEDLVFTLNDTELNLFNGDGVAALRQDAQAMLEGAVAVTITGNGLTLAQAALIYEANQDSFDSTVLTITDTAAAIVASVDDDFFSDSDTITVNVSPTAVSGLNVLELGTLMTRIDNDDDVTYSLSLGELEIFTGNDLIAMNEGYAAAITGATSVEVTDALTPAQGTAIIALNEDAVYSVSSDATDATIGGNAAGMNGADNITITGTASAAQATIIADFTNSGDTTYNVEDDATDATDGANAAGMNGATDITITGTASAAQATTIAGFTNSGDTTYNVEDDATDATNGANAAGMNGATDITITGTVLVNQGATIAAFTNSGDTVYNISDSKAGVFVDATAAYDSANAINGATSVIVTATLDDHNTYISVAQAALLKQSLSDSTPLTAISYSIYDTKAAILASEDDALFTTVGGITVADVDIDNTALGTISLTDYTTLVARIGGDQVLTYTLSYTVDQIFTTATGVIYKVDMEAAVSGATELEITDPLNVAQALAIRTTRVDLDEVTFDLSDEKANLFTDDALIDTDVADVVTQAANVEVTNAINLAQATAINTARTDLNEVTFDLNDTETNLLGSDTGTTWAGIATTAISKADSLTITGNGLSLAQAAMVYIANTNSYTNVTFDLSDAETNLFTGDTNAAWAAGAAAAITAAGAVTITGNGLSLAQAAMVYIANTNSYTNVTFNLTDTETALFGADDVFETGAEAAVAAATNIVITETLNLTQAGLVYTANGGNYTNVTFNLTDTETALFGADDAWEAGAEAAVTAATNIVITEALNVAQAGLVKTANGDSYTNVTFDVTDTFAHINGAAEALLAAAGTVKLSDYDLGQVEVADVQALLDYAAHLNDTDGNSFTVDDLTFTLLDTTAHLVSSDDDTAAIVAQATGVEASDDASVANAKIIYDRNTHSTYDITDSAAWLATTTGVGSGAIYETVIAAAGDLTANTTASASQAQTIYNRDGAGGDLFYNVSDSFAYLTTGAYATGVSYAENITRSSGYSDYWSGAANDAAALYLLATDGDGNGNANLFLGNLYYDTVADWSGVFDIDARVVVEGTLEYTYKVYDTAANITTAADGGGDLSILTSSEEVYVSDNMSVSQAETLWNAVLIPFGGENAPANEVTTAAQTRYYIIDSVAKLSNIKVSVDATADEGDNAAVANADGIYVSDTAALIHAAQNSNSTIDSSDAQVFQRIDELASGSITATASAGNQVIAGSKFADNLDAGNDNDTLYGNVGNDTLYGGAGNDTLYGGNDRDTIYAGSGAGVGVGTNYRSTTDWIYGGNGGDNMYGSGILGDYDRDQFIYSGATKDALKAESGTYTSSRDYISNFGLGDSIDFSSVSDANVQFFGSGSANAIAIDAGTLGISIRYEKNQQVMNWADTALVTATKVMVDIADANGNFDDVADMHIIIVGTNLDLNWNGSALAYGG